MCLFFMSLLMMVVVFMRVTMMLVIGRTGRVVSFSTARFAVVAAACLAEDDPGGNVDCQAGQFFTQGHGLA
jgi:hypothetical protein